MTVLFACRDCGQIHRVPPPPLTNRWLLCRRCGRRLWRSPRRGLDRPFAYATGAIVLFLIANGFTLFEIGFAGARSSGLIISGAVQLTRYDAGVVGVGALVALISIILPALTLTLVFAVLARLVVTHPDNTRRRPIALAWKLPRHLRQWSMLDVYLLGAVVAYTRLGRLADVVIGAGGYALAALVLVQVLIEQSLGRQHVWRAIGDPAMYAPAPGEPWILCLGCELVVATSG